MPAIKENEHKHNEIKTPGGNKLWCEDGVLKYRISAMVDGSEAVVLSGEGLKMCESVDVALVLIDLKQSTQFSSEARKIWVEFLRSPKIKKTAIFGGNVFVRTLASFVIAASRKENIKFFSNEEEALEWLKKS